MRVKKLSIVLESLPSVLHNAPLSCPPLGVRLKRNSLPFNSLKQNKTQKGNAIVQDESE